MAVKAKAPAATKPEFGTMKRMAIADLRGATHNPKSRTASNSNPLKRLIRSIEEIGLIYPIAIDKEGTVIDGHRRLTACKHMGWTEVPVIVVPNENASLVYAEVNANAEMMSGLQILQVYLQQPDAVAAKTRKTLERYEEVFGRVTMKKLVKAKLSFHTLGLAQRIARYVEDESDEYLNKVVEYLITKRNGRIVRSYITLKQAPSTLWDVIRKGRNLELAFA